MAMGISLSPEKGTNVVETGKKIDEKIVELKEKLPIGINIEKVYYQPDLVIAAIDNFCNQSYYVSCNCSRSITFYYGNKETYYRKWTCSFNTRNSYFYVWNEDRYERVSLGSFIIAMGMLVDNSSYSRWSISKKK